VWLAEFSRTQVFVDSALGYHWFEAVIHNNVEAPATQDLIDAVIRYAEPGRQFHRLHLHFFQFINKNLAGMDRIVSFEWSFA
jgi:hypothetical protein